MCTQVPEIMIQELFHYIRKKIKTVQFSGVDDGAVYSDVLTM